MARFQLTSAHTFAGRRYKAGTIITDGTGAQAGDVLVSGFAAANVSNNMTALDAGATTMKSASRFTGAVTMPYPDGANSIEG